MSRPSGPSLRWLTLAVLLPLLVLAVLAWLGTRAQLKAAWTEAREEATRRAEEYATEMASLLHAGVVEVPIFPDPPVPGASSDKDEVLDGTDVSALLALRDDAEAGLSPAGLPRRVLAALRVQSLDPAAQSSEELIALVTTAAPSVLTGKALQVAGAPEDRLRAWTETEEACRIARKEPESASRGFWKSGTDGTWWIEVVGESIRILAIPKVTLPPPEKRSGVSLQPAWLRMFTPLLAEAMWGAQVDHDYSGETLLSEVPIAFGSDLRVLAYADPVVLEQGIRRQQRWTIALLATAVVVSVVSLLAIQRVVARERRLAELKTQFVSSVSHELRAPLGSIRLMAEALEQEKVARPAEFHKLIAREGTRLSHLIENVLDFARIEDGRKRYRFEECDLTALVRDTVDLLEPLARERGISLEPDLAELTATLDPAAVQQAIVNLLDNAIKFSPKGEVVQVTLSESEGQWRLAISDQGPGIPAAEHEQIFERFHRLGNELRRETRGTGIGLSIVKHVAEAHGGSVTLVSNPPDGATFTVCLPLDPCAS